MYLGCSEKLPGCWKRRFRLRRISMDVGCDAFWIVYDVMLVGETGEGQWL